MLPCCREEREVWIRAKYEKKEYLADLPTGKLTLGEVSAFPASPTVITFDVVVSLCIE